MTRPAEALSLPVRALRALGLGLVAGLVLPLAALYAVLGLGHLAGGCGPGSAGGCEMGAAMVALYAVVPSFLIGAGFSLFRDRHRRRA